MGLFSNNNNKNNIITVDKNTPSYAVMKYNSARSNLLIAIVLTLVNIIVGSLGGSVYLLFSISFPYMMFDITDIVWSIPAIVVLGLFIAFYILCKKKPGFMIAALVAFILDSLFLVGYSILLSNVPELEITVADFIIDYITHLWLLIYLIIGARYTMRYKKAITSDPSVLEGSFFQNASLSVSAEPAAEMPVYSVSEENAAAPSDTEKKDE